MININDSLVQEYIKILKTKTYLDFETNGPKTYAENYRSIIATTTNTIDSRRSGTNRLVEYYVNRLNQNQRILDTLNTVYATDNIEVNYNIFNGYTNDMFGKSTDMDTINGTLNYSLSFITDKIRQLTREQKVLTKTIAKLGIVTDGYDSIKTDLTTLDGALA